MKIYFCGAIRGGREKVNDYIKIISKLEEYGKVLDKHVANPNLSQNGENITDAEIYKRDINWINECDIVFAEVTTPSLGVGYELGYAESKNKKIICMYEDDKKISGMIGGNHKFERLSYANIDELLEKIDKSMKK